jgi:hypothetical protein
VDVNISVNWRNVTLNTSTAATIEVDVMPFLGRTSYGGPFDAYYEALSQLGSEFVRYSPWFPNPRAVVAELSPSDCTAAQPATNWNSTVFDEIIRDFMAAVCGVNAASGTCTKSVVQQLSTMPGWLYVGGMNESELPRYAWNTTSPFDRYGAAGSSLVDPSCGQLARYFGRLVGHYTNGGHHDECGHWHPSGFNYSWWGISVLNEDEHHLAPDHGPAYVQCFDAIAAEVARVNPRTVLVGPEEVADNEMMLYFLNGSNHVNDQVPKVASYHAGMRADNASAPTFFDQWDKQLVDTVKVFEDFKQSTGQATEFVLNEYIPFVQDWCDCKGMEHACGGERFPTGGTTQCPSWQEPSTAGGDPDLQHAAGIGMNKRTWSWNAAAAVFAYGYATLAELQYKYVGQDQLIGGTWPDNEPDVSCLDWQTGQANAKYWVTHLLATTVGDAQIKSLVETTLLPAKTQPKPTSCSVSLTKQLSDKGQCIKDKSFGCYSNNYSMWTEDCRGDFLCDGYNVECNVGSSTRVVCTCSAEMPVHAMAYVKQGQPGMLLVNKGASHITVQIGGDREVCGGDAMVVEVDTVGEFRDEPATAPPVARQLSPGGSLQLGPYAVAVVTRFAFC